MAQLKLRSGVYTGFAPHRLHRARTGTGMTRSRRFPDLVSRQAYGAGTGPIDPFCTIFIAESAKPH